MDKTLIRYPNSAVGIRAYEFVLFGVLKPHIMGLRFDIKSKNSIVCMYQFGICNYFINFETFDYLNIHDIFVKLY